MNTERIAVKALAPGDTFRLVGCDTLYVADAVRTSMPFTRVEYHVAGTFRINEWTPRMLTTVERILP